MYQVACTFKSKQATDQPYQFLQEYLRESDSDCSIFRLLLNNVWTIAIVGSMVTPAMQRAIDKLLPIKQRITLPQKALQSLIARREKRSDEATPVPGKPGYKVTEQHTPTRLNLDGTPVPVTPEDLTRLMREEALQTTHEAVERTRAKEPKIMHVPDAETAMKAFDAIIAPNPVGTPSPLPVGSKVKMQTVPFIRGYEALHQQITTDDVIARVKQEYRILPDNATRAITIIGDIEKAVLKAATKYRFTSSAIALLTSVVHEGTVQAHMPVNHTWIEFDTPFSHTVYGENIRAIYAYNAFPLAEINRVIPETKDRHLHDVVLKTFLPHRVQWSLDLITTRCQTMFDFTYDTLTKRWIYLGSHICPYHTCKYIQESEIEAVCLPCNTCKAACTYWASWFHYALKIINGDYALSPETPTFQVEPQMFEEDVKIKVGKGKNARLIQTTKTRHIDFYVVKFDASIKQPVRTPASKEEKLAASHPNWLVTTDKGDVIWVRKRIAEYKRHYPSGYTTQHPETDLVTVKAHPKYVPMLKPEKRKADTITKIIASQYESEVN